MTSYYYTPRSAEDENGSAYPLGIYARADASATDNAHEAAKAFRELTGRAVYINPDVLPRGTLAICQSLLPDFWHIETTLVPSEMKLTDQEFDEDLVHEKRSAEFFLKWHKRFKDEFEFSYGVEDYILIALTKDLSAPNAPKAFDSFEMIDHVLTFEPTRPVVIRLPDDAKYTQEEFERLTAYDMHERVTFSKANIDRLLDGCAYVVTQDSPVGVKAFFHLKNVIQYAPSPYHHIAEKPYLEKRLIRSFNRANRARPNYSAYAYWLFHGACIDASGTGGKERLLKALHQIG